MDFLLYVLALIATLGVLVTFHELGHFVIARASGVKIVRFSIGFGSPIWSRQDSRGTEFAVAALPLGGYVRMYDERDLGAGSLGPGEVSYNALTPWWRIAIALGGPVANFILAFLVYWIMFLGGTTAPVPMVSEVPQETPVAEAGLVPGQVIYSVDGEQTLSWQQVLIGLAARLGDTGVIELGVGYPGTASPELISVPISAWHRGERDPDMLGSLGIQPGWPAVVGHLEEDGAAKRAGFQQWDRVVASDGEPVAGWAEWVQIIQASPGRELQTTVERDGQQRILLVTPDEVKATDGTLVGYLGVGLPSNTIEYGPLGAFLESGRETADKTMLTLGLLRKMVTGDVSVANLSSPIMIAKVAGDSARSGWWSFLGVLGLLSISLGVLNLLPIPILDGGHIVYCVGELVMGRPVSERVQMLGTQVGLFLVVGMLVLAVYNDLLRLF